MIFLFLIYFFTIFVVNCLLRCKRHKFYPIQHAVITKNGIYFTSNKVHRIKIHQSKIIVLKNMVYLIKEHNIIVIKNINRIFLRNDYLYFKSCGEVEILFNNSVYKYFNLVITSDNFSINELKQRAIEAIINNLFNFSKNKDFVNYISFLIYILNIRITNKGVYITKNVYKLNYCITYKINNKIKRVKIG